MKQLSPTWITVLLLAGFTTLAMAETPLTPKAVFAAESKKALARYEDDKLLCNEETVSKARLQCRRDAKTEYDKAIAAAKVVFNTPVAAPVAKAPCLDCAKVLSVSMTEKEGEGSALGVLGGGAAGAVLGHQVGGGFGKDLATIAGAVGGAYAGKKLEEKMKTQKIWTVAVQYADGHKNSFNFEQDPGFKAGDAVKNSGTTIVRD
jgi:uncharacterized protein YcfJ